MPDPMHIHSVWAAGTAAVAPMLAFGGIMVFLRRQPRVSAGLSLGAIGLSLVCALYLLIRHWDMKAPLCVEARWMASGDLIVPVGLLLDPLSLLMLTIVAVICFLVQLYSLAYMAGDPGFSRYFAFMSLFAWAMISLVISPNLLQLYIFWELVGLASYLLIGFWYQKFSATHAGKKAFVMTRTGDLAFLLGLLLLLASAGNLDILSLNSVKPAADLSQGRIAMAGLLILGGIVGKSAQFPLLTWLPDAMEGPTPVSALLHSATMVAAGVYLFGRLFPFFSQAPAVMTVTLAIGTLSMLLAATMALVSRDIKQVWAFSTISQLGYMLMGLGAGGYFSGVFHLTTHAGFKALLFLCAGALIHAFDTNDLFELGNRGAGKMKTPILCTLVAGAALSGLWPFSGFFSKEAILAQLAGLDHPGWLAVGILGAFFTAYYTFRLIFIILFPKGEQSEESQAHAPHPTDPRMAVPLIALALITIGLGFFQQALAGFLAPRGEQALAHGPAWLAPTTLGLALLAVGLAWLEFGRQNAPQIGFVERVPGLFALFSRRWYLDHLYAWALDHLVDKGIANWCKQNDDQVIDGMAHGLGNGLLRSGRWVSGWHQALIQTKLMVLFAAVFGLTLMILIIG